MHGGINLVFYTKHFWYRGGCERTSHHITQMVILENDFSFKKH
jgi:hypothetical protein